MNKKEDLGKMRGFSRVTAAVIIIIAIVALLVFLILFRLNFMIGEQLRITLSPEYSEVQATSPGSVPFELTVHLYNKFVCNAICNYTLTDTSYNILLDNGTFNSKAYKSKSYSFNIPLDYYGSGTNTYLYKLECRNIPTTLCPASDEILLRKSLLVVKYSPSREQLEAKEFLESNYIKILENMINSSKLIDSDGQIIGSANDSNIVFNTSKYYALRSDRDTLLESIDGLMSLWKNGDFVSTKSYIVDIKLLSRTSNLLSNITQYDSDLINVINDYNALLTDLTSVHSTLQEYRKLLLLNVFNIDASTKQSMINYLSSGNTLINQFNSKNYNQGLLHHKVIELGDSTVELNKVIVNSTNAELSRDLPSIYIYSHMLCMIDGSNNENNNTNSTNNINSTTNSSNISTSVIKTKDFCNFNYNTNATNLIDASTKLKNVCDRTSLILNNVNSQSHVADSKETLLLQYKLLIDYESMSISAGNNKENSVLTYYANYLTDSLRNLYNITDPETFISEYKFDSSKSELTFSKDNKILMDIKDVDELCNSNVSVPNLVSLRVKYYPTPTNLSTSSSEVSLPSYPELVPQCCMYGKCQSCEKKSTKNPLILLHGHSFNKDVNAYQSVETFNSFEQEFRNDGLYFQSGLLVNNVNSTAGILGHFNIPLVSKPTYYLETYNSLLGLTVSESKTGNIDTYALRLKETIDYTMAVTGSNKVDIVAHSMGGLVVRRYMQIFGTQNVGTVILIGTPNNGVSEKTYTLCKIFGAVNECEDMRASGIFIKKLNDYSNQPTIKDMYLVIGKGCDTDGLDGDGVVTINSSLMNVPENRILYVNGKCSGTNLLHGELLNVNTHPEVYTFVKDKLRQNK